MTKGEREARWTKQSREDSTVVLMALVASVTAASSATAAAAVAARPAGSLSSPVALAGGDGSSAGVGGSSSFGGARGGVGRDKRGLKFFCTRESEALSSVCVEALRALVRPRRGGEGGGVVTFVCHIFVGVSAPMKKCRL